MNKKNVQINILAYIRLSKPIITLSVAFSSLTGFVLAQQSFHRDWIPAYLGVLLIAAGASVINQIQEASMDRLMDRTRNRPLPSGLISLFNARIWAVILSVSGTGVLWVFTNPPATALAIITLVWYNGIYTPLKKVTPWAILPGAIVGAIPPAIGWAAAGESLLHPHVIFLSFFFFIGQIPHFWLILLRYSDDYNNAGFPNITSAFNPGQIKRLTFSWIFATAASALLLPFSGVVKSQVLTWVTIMLSLLLVLIFFYWSFIKPFKVNRAFILMNSYFLLMMVVILADSVY